MVILLACQDVSAVPEPLATAALVSRLSLDLRGIRATEVELSRAESDPAALPDMVDEFLVHPGFGERLVTLYADVYLTRSDSFVVGANGDADFLDEPTKQRFLRSVGEEPLRLIQRIADDDLPYTTLVTADWTMADDALLRAFPLESMEERGGWRMARYTDHRPAVGILATNGLWWRYTTTLENVNRGRAEVIARNLLCDDRFDQPVAFGGAVEVVDFSERVKSDPACIPCHSVLDPLGSFLFGFYRVHSESYSEALWYYPGRELMWQSRTGIAPAFYGQPSETLHDLGQLIAADSRFPNCVVEQGFEFLMARSPTFEDTERISASRDDFLTGNMTLRALYRSLVSDPRYLSTDETFDGTVPLKVMGPDQLASAVEDLTGFRWTWLGADMLTTDTYGVRMLAGGADGLIVTRPAEGHATTSALTTQRLAESAAAFAVGRESGLAANDRRLFREVDPDTDASSAMVAVQVAALVLRVHGRRVSPTHEDVASLVSLWDDVAAEGGPSRAWTAVLTGLLRHPDFLQY